MTTPDRPEKTLETSQDVKVRVLMKNPDREPTTPDDHEVAQKALSQLAEADGLKLTGPVLVIGTSYSEAERLYVTAYGSRAVPDPAVASVISTDPGGYAAIAVRAEAMVLRAHRSPLHSTQVVTSAVEGALDSGEPLAALVALHLLGISADSNEALEHFHRTLQLTFPSE